MTHDVLACWFEVDRSTITRAIGEVRPLLADRGCRIDGGLRLRTLADVIAHLGATGQTALMDATEIRVRPALGPPRRPQSVHLRQEPHQRDESRRRHGPAWPAPLLR
ncbi:transposase family protein [Streptomyces sp. H27-H1]|nr:transposase family protein [Streptomyces sp. H27-H1]